MAKIVEGESKRCTTCKLVKSLKHFSKHSQAKDGLNSQCKLCKQRHDNEAYAKKKFAKFNYWSMKPWKGENICR